MIESMKQVLSLLRRRDLDFLIILALLAAGAWLFIELADEVTEGSTRSIDESILLSLRDPGDRNNPIGPPWIEEIGRDLTALGGIAVMALLIATVIGFLLLQGKFRMALLMAASIGSGLLFSLLLKTLFDRPRPDLVPHQSYVYTTSFPSGHSMVSAVVYLTLAALLARSYRKTHTKLYLLTVACILTGLVGLSRIYLGVHWPTDVLAGWTAGAFWALLWWGIGYSLQLHGRVESEGTEPEPIPRHHL